jgi:hypothetical protein
MNSRPRPLFDTLEQVQVQYKQCQSGNSKKVILSWLNQCFHNAGFTLPVYAYKDYQHVLNFLYSYRGSIDTFNSYRRELERLIQWCWLIQNKSLLLLRRTDIETFIEFCKNPYRRWIGVKTVSRFFEENVKRKSNTSWRPLIVKISKKSYQDGEKTEKINF